MNLWIMILGLIISILGLLIALEKDGNNELNNTIGAILMIIGFMMILIG